MAALIIARELIALGHKVHLIPPQYVKPYVKRSKNDRNDAEAICEAAGRPGMHFVPVKSVAQQAQGMVLKVRESLVGQRTLLVSTLRGHAAEFGVIAGKGLGKIGPLLAAFEQETAIPSEAKDMAALLGQQIAELDTRIKDIEAKLTAAHKANSVSQRWPHSRRGPSHRTDAGDRDRSGSVRIGSSSRSLGRSDAKGTFDRREAAMAGSAGRAMNDSRLARRWRDLCDQIRHEVGQQADRAVFRLALRQTEGLIGSIARLLGLALAVPDHSTLSRRAETLEVIRPRPSGAPVHLLVDSTGLRLCGPGEWLVENHGVRTRRSWRKLHLGVDADTGEIVAAELTAHDADDGSQVGPLLNQVGRPVASFTGDGAFDRDDVYGEVAARHPDAAVIVPPRSSAVPSETAHIAPTKRDKHLQLIAERGRMHWQKASGYNDRALVEADIARLDDHGAGRLLLEEGNQFGPPELALQLRLPGIVGSMNLEDKFGSVQADHGNAVQTGIRLDGQCPTKSSWTAELTIPRSDAQPSSSAPSAHRYTAPELDRSAPPRVWHRCHRR